MSRVFEQNASVATVSDFWRDFIARSKALCRTVASRDLAGLPLYILLQSEVADIMGQENFSDGYTTPNLDLNLRSVIGDRWHGRGPCMVLNDVSIADEHFPEDVDIVAMSTILHELAHILDRPVPGDLWSQPSEDWIEFETKVIANAGRHETRPLPTPYFGHEDQFVRIALHLHHRSGLAGVDTIPNLLCAGRRYCLSHAHRYIEAIASEPADMLQLSFAEISRSDPPKAFTKLWLRDVSRYVESFSNP
jgi:hypothetical protein